MPRRRTDIPISLFSFQDIIMSVVGVVILITLILLLQLVSEMLAAPPSPTITEQELRQQITALQLTLADLQDSIAELHRAKERAEVFTPSQDQADALQSTVARLEAAVALAEKKIEEIKKRITELKNNPANQQLLEMVQEIKDLTDKLAGLKQQTTEVAENIAELQAKVQELRAKNTTLEQQLAERTVLQLKVTVPQGSNKKVFILVYGQGTITVIPADGSPKQTFSSRSQFSAWIGRRNPSEEHFVVYVRPSRFGEHDAIVKDLRVRGFDVGLQIIGEKTNLSLDD